MKLLKIADRFRKYSAASTNPANLYNTIVNAIVENHYSIVMKSIADDLDQEEGLVISMEVSNQGGPEWSVFVSKIENVIDKWFATRRAYFVLSLELISNDDEKIPPKRLVKGPSVSVYL